MIFKFAVGCTKMDIKHIPVFFYIIFVTMIYSDYATEVKDYFQHSNEENSMKNGGSLFVNAIFKKYGNGQVMSFEAFEHLLENLGIGNLKIDHGWIKHETNISKLSRIHINHKHEIYIQLNDRKNHHENHQHASNKYFRKDTDNYNNHNYADEKHGKHNDRTSQHTTIKNEHSNTHNGEHESFQRHLHKDRNYKHAEGKNDTNRDHRHQPTSTANVNPQHVHNQGNQPQIGVSPQYHVHNHENQSQTDLNPQHHIHNHGNQPQTDINPQHHVHNHGNQSQTGVKSQYHENHHHSKSNQLLKKKTNRNLNKEKHHHSEDDRRSGNITKSRGLTDIKIKKKNIKITPNISARNSTIEEAKDRHPRRNRNGRLKKKGKRKNRNRSKGFGNIPSIKMRHNHGELKFNMSHLTLNDEKNVYQTQSVEDVQISKMSGFQGKQNGHIGMNSEISQSESLKKNKSNTNTTRDKRNTSKNNQGIVLETPFENLERTHEDHQTSIVKCFRPQELLHMHGYNEESDITVEEFLQLCPAIVYQVDIKECKSFNSHIETQHHHTKPKLSDIPKEVWGYGTGAIAVISFAGLLVVSMIPLLRKMLMTSLLQFFVALAVGALSGDALLHLIPHSLQPHDSHHGDGEHGEEEQHNLEGVYKGLCGLSAIYFFFVFGRIQTIVNNRNKKNKPQKKNRKDPDVNGQNKPFICSPSNEGRKSEKQEELGESDPDVHSHANTQGHSHNHSHNVSSSIPALAWRVVIGDGVHNLCDGLAIGVAFANSITGGISTSIAVLCHELPHEMGDFAVLLSKGMSVKQAILCNCISSLLSLIGMYAGILLGNIGQASLWIFVAVAGMFLYISLVDLIPELNNVIEKGTNSEIKTLLVQFSGIVTGSGIMLIIAIFENDLTTVLKF